MKKCWNLLLSFSLLLTICALPLPAGATDIAPGTNLVQGSYSWAAWGHLGAALDGNLGTHFNVGKHSAQNPYYMGTVTNTGEIEKYNKIVFYIFEPAGVLSYALTGYDSVGDGTDPGANAGTNAKPAAESGVNGVTIIPRTTIEDAAMDTDNYNKVVVELEEAKESKYFFWSWWNADGCDGGLYEFQVYYVTPADVSWDDGSVTLYRPTSGSESYEYDIPAYTVYDQLGDALGDNLLAAFPGTLTLAQDYDGVTMDNGKLAISAACTAEEIELNYVAQDTTTGATVLEKTLRIAVMDDISATIAYLNGVIPSETEENITLPTSYTAKDDVTISWESSNPIYIGHDGTVTRPSFETGDQTVTLTATITAADGASRKQSYTVVVLKEDLAKSMLDSAKNALTWDTVSVQPQTAVTRNLTLPTVEEGALVIGENSYEGMDISWSSDNPSVISNEGVVTRQDSDTDVTLTATLSMQDSVGATRTEEIVFNTKVLAKGTAKNLLQGGYGWIHSVGWSGGNSPGNAVDGDRTTKVSSGNHGNGNSYIAVGMPSELGTQKYNKVKLYYYPSVGQLQGLYLNSYSHLDNDPGTNNDSAGNTYNSTVAATAQDETRLLYYANNFELLDSSSTQHPGTSKDGFAYYLDETEAPVNFSEPMTLELTEPATGRIFYLEYKLNATASESDFGLYEIEAYYATPDDVSWDAGVVTMNTPMNGTLEYDIPAYTVYDEMGDALGENLLAAFPGTLTPVQEYDGVTIENGKIKITSACTTDAIEFVYKAVDSEGRTMLEKTLRIAVGNDITNTIAYLQETLPSETAQSISLPTSYKAMDDVTISWTSSNPEYITSDGTVTRPSYATGNVTVTLTATIRAADGTEETQDFLITILRGEPDGADQMLEDAAGKLTWDLLSTQEQTAVSKALTLPYAQNGTLTLGESSYAGMEISWSSDNEAVLSSKGVITRQEEDTTVTLTAILSAEDDAGVTRTWKKDFTVTVVAAGKSVDTKNLLLGGYGWIYNSGWGGNAPGNIVDGNYTTRVSSGNHANGSSYIAAAMPTDLGVQKYNKVVLYFYQNGNPVVSYYLNGYNSLPVDPGRNSNTVGNTSNSLKEGTNEVKLLTYSASTDGAVPEKLVLDLDEAVEGRLFYLEYQLNASSPNDFGLYEIEAYYVTPNEVRWDDPDSVTMSAPLAGGTALSYDVPAYTVYDEFGDEIVTGGFTSSLTLAENYAGVTLENGKITLTDDCTVSEINLLYTSADAEKTYLSQLLTIPVAAATTDYADVNAAAEWLAGQLPATTAADLTLPTSYTGTNEVSISWASNNTAYIAADGTVTQPNAAVGDVTVTLTATITCGESTIQKNFNVTVTAESANTATETLAEAGAALTWDLLSTQEQTAVSKALALPKAENGTLTLGSNRYPGMSVSWSSNNEAVLSSKGVVTRQQSNTNVILTATLSMSYSGRTYTLDVPFEVTVVAAGTAVDSKNLMAGGYGWINNGWGEPTKAVDGDRGTLWNAGEHSVATPQAGLKTASGEVEKFNKVVIYFYRFDHIASYTITGYTAGTNDPGSASANLGFTAGTGARGVLSYSEDDPVTIPDENGMVEAKFTTTMQSKYFGFAVNNTDKDDKGSNIFGVYEFEIYFLTPSVVSWDEGEVTMYRPATAGETTSFDIPAYTVYDEYGDEIIDTSFTGTIALAENYAGVTLENGKLSFTSSCTADEIDLIYTSSDADETYLQQILTISVIDTDEDYYTMLDVADYLDTLVPSTATENLELPTSYDGVTIEWSSDNEDYLAADGTVTRPEYGTEDESATLTAVLTIGNYTTTKTWNVTVAQDATDEQIALLDANRIDLGISGIVSSDIDLPTTGYYGSTITWSSSNPSAISNTGAYTLTTSTSSSTRVVLTATVTYNGKSVTKEIPVYARTTATGSSGGGGGGGGRGTSNSGTNVSVATTPNTMTPLTDEQLETGLFNDVPSSHWAREYVDALAARKVINGVDGSHFEPDRSITREEFLKMVITAFEITLKPGDIGFADVSADEWYADYVATAYKEGLINGMSETEFGIGRNITRQDAAVIVQRALDRLNVEYSGAGKVYGDESDIAGYAAEAVQNLTKIGIIEGNTEGNFLPLNNATRAEAAKIIYTAMEYGGMW